MRTNGRTSSSAKGFTLVETLIGLLVIFTILYAAPTVLQSYRAVKERAEKVDTGRIYLLLSDITYGMGIARNVIIEDNGNVLEIERYDGCKVRYAFEENGGIFEKTAQSCEDPGTKIKMNDVERAYFDKDGDVYYLSLKMKGESETRRYAFKKL